MKDVGNVTRVQPDKRVDSLMNFRRRLAENLDVRRFLRVHGYIKLQHFFFPTTDSKRTRELGSEV